MTTNEILDFVGERPIAPWQIRHEIEKLVEIVSERRPRVVLEIGTARGGTLFLWTRSAHPQATLISIDLPGGEFGGGYPKWKMPTYRSFALPGQKIHLLRANSHSVDTLRQVKSILGDRRVDFLFIDADHTYEGVKRDYDVYSPLLSDRGLVALHDIATSEGHENHGVTRFWQDIKQGHSTLEIVNRPPLGIAGIGVILANEACEI